LLSPVVVFIETAVSVPVYGLAIGIVAATPLTYLMTCVLLALKGQDIDDVMTRTSSWPLGLSCTCVRSDRQRGTARPDPHRQP